MLIRAPIFHPVISCAAFFLPFFYNPGFIYLIRSFVAFCLILVYHFTVSLRTGTDPDSNDHGIAKHDSGGHMIEKFRDELSRVPEKPGVYIMHDADGTILYVGKAIVLRNRLKSYFADIPHSARITAMISHIDHFEYIVCDSELEALLLENNLIKKHKPKYNVLLKDDKGYPYIKVTLSEHYPRVILARRIEKDGGRYFGPYFSAFTVKQLLETIEGIVPLRTCSRKIDPTVWELAPVDQNPPADMTGDRPQSDSHSRGADKPRSGAQFRPCLNYHMGRCRGACAGKISEKEYGEMVDLAIDFLSGNTKAAEKRLRDNMQAAAEQLEFEQAAMYRNRLKALEQLKERQKTSLLNDDNFDAVAVAKNSVDACVVIFFVRSGKVTGRDLFVIEGAADASDGELIEAFLKDFYSENQFIPPKIYLDAPLDEEFDVDPAMQLSDVAAGEIASSASDCKANATSGCETDSVPDGKIHSTAALLEQALSALRGSKVHMSVPRIGDKKKICALARENAAQVLENREKAMLAGKPSERETRALARIQEAFGLAALPGRIEAYDISNQGDSEINASMVVFIGGKPSKSDYRLFKMKRVQARSDTDSMTETLERRLKRYAEGSRGFEVLPDLILADGGLGQVNAIIDVLHKFGISIPVLGMVKDDRHRSRALIGPEIHARNDYSDDNYTGDRPSSFSSLHTLAPAPDNGPHLLTRANSREFDLRSDTDVWRFITAVQDEAHRVAISYNRKLTEKRYTKSSLDTLPGVGEKRKLLLYKEFGSIAGVNSATVDELARVPGIGRKLAESIYASLHPST